MLIRLLFVQKLHFPQVDLKNVRYFAASNQCNRPDFLEPLHLSPVDPDEFHLGFI